MCIRDSARGRAEAHESGDGLLTQHGGGIGSASSGVLLRTQANVIDQQGGGCAGVVNGLLLGLGLGLGLGLELGLGLGLGLA